MPVDDPDFQKLSLADKNAYLLDTDPDFKALAPRDRVDYLKQVHYGEAQPTQPAAPIVQKQGFLGAIGEDVLGAMKGLPSLLSTGPLGSIDQSRQTAQAVLEGWQRDKELGYGAVERGLHGLGRLGGMNIDAMTQAAEQGDTAAVLGHTALPVAMAASPLIAEGAGVGLKKIQPTPEALTARGLKGITTGAMPKIGKAGQLGEQWVRDLEAAKPHLSKISREGEPLTGRTLKQMLTRRGEPEWFNEASQNIADYKADLWEKTHKAPLERHAQASFDSAETERQALSEIKTQDDLVQSDKAREWVEREMPRIRTLADADERIRLLNQEIKKLPENEYGPVGIRVRLRALQSLREQLDQRLESLGEKGVKENNRAYGALRNIEQRLHERYFQETGKAAKSSAVPDWFHPYLFSGLEHFAAGLSLRPGEIFRPDLMREFGKGWQAIGRAGLEPEPPFTPAPGDLPNLAGYYGRALPPLGGTPGPFTISGPGPEPVVPYVGRRTTRGLLGPYEPPRPILEPSRALEAGRFEEMFPPMSVRGIESEVALRAGGPGSTTPREWESQPLAREAASIVTRHPKTGRMQRQYLSEEKGASAVSEIKNVPRETNPAPPEQIGSVSEPLGRIEATPELRQAERYAREFGTPRERLELVRTQRRLERERLNVSPEMKASPLGRVGGGGPLGKIEAGPLEPSWERTAREKVKFSEVWSEMYRRAKTPAEKRAILEQAMEE